MSDYIEIEDVLQDNDDSYYKYAEDYTSIHTKVICHKADVSLRSEKHRKPRSYGEAPYETYYFVHCDTQGTTLKVEEETYKILSQLFLNGEPEEEAEPPEETVVGVYQNVSW